MRLAVLTNQIAVDGIAVALGERETELLSLLVLSGGYGDAQILADLMFPGMDYNDAARALWDCIRSLAQALPNPSILRSEKHGYRLDAALAVDLWEIEVYLRSRAGGRPRCSVSELLYRRLLRFNQTYRYTLANWAWSLPLRGQIDAYRREVGIALATDLLAEGRIYEAHRTATQIVTAFPNSDRAHALALDIERRLIDNYLLARPRAG